MIKLKSFLRKSYIIKFTILCSLIFTLPAIAGWVILQQSDPDIRDYMTIAFTSERTGWTAGSAAFEDFENPGFIGFTMDGGKTWERSEIKLESDLTEIYFFDDNHGWVVGQNGIIANTTNGKDWDIQISKVGTTLTSIYFVSKDVGFAVGQNDTIISTKNGGRQWKVLQGGIVGEVGDDDASMFNAVQFIDEKNGWIAGVRVFPTEKTQKTVILKTDDGAQTWTPQETGKEDILEDIFFLDASVGWAVGENGLILHTDNGGNTWTEQTSGTEETIRSVRFADKNIGWAVGGDIGVGVVLSTTDGGQTWTLEESEVKMEKVSVLDKQNAWLVGTNGFIIKPE